MLKGVDRRGTFVNSNTPRLQKSSEFWGVMEDNGVHCNWGVMKDNGVYWGVMEDNGGYWCLVG